MDNKSDEQFLVIQSKIDANKQETGEKQMNNNKKLTQITEYLKVFTETITYMMDQTNISKFSLARKDTSNHPDPITTVPANRRAPQLDGGHSTKIGGMWTLKHEIISPKFHELLIKT